jgi:hypothetical protein
VEWKGKAVVVEGRGGGSGEIKLVWKSQGGGNGGIRMRKSFFFVPRTWTAYVSVQVQQETKEGGLQRNAGLFLFTGGREILATFLRRFCGAWH